MNKPLERLYRVEGLEKETKGSDEKLLEIDVRDRFEPTNWTVILDFGGVFDAGRMH